MRWRTDAASRALRADPRAAAAAGSRLARRRFRRYSDGGDPAGVISPVVFGARLGVLSALVAVPVVVLQLVLVVLLSRLAVTVFGQVARSRIGSAVVGVLVAGLLILSQFGWMLAVAVRTSGLPSTGVTPAFATLVRALPSGWGLYAVEAVPLGNSVSWCELGLLRDQLRGWHHLGVLLSLAYRLLRFLFSLLAVLVRCDLSKDIELLVLRHENQVLRRRLGGRLRWDHADRLWLAALSRLVSRRQWPEIFPVTPATILRWHRNLVARKWDYTSRRRPGRPSTGISVKALIVRMARENPAWGHRRIQGELARLGHAIAASTVWEILHAAGIDPAPRRAGPTWRQFLTAQAHAIIACDFLVVETVLLQRLYVLVFIEHAPGGCTWPG
jgi:transposase